MTQISIVTDHRELRHQIREWQRRDLRIGFVPTMGYLHKGHISLVEYARRYADRVVVSIFVNPTQFAAGEDISNYPRDLIGDYAKLEQAQADLVFVPDVQSIYAVGSQTYIEVQELSQPLCGKYRPTHFRGVTTVVAKLFILVTPDIAVFGEKDYQQLLVLKQMTSDMLWQTEIIGVPIVREPDGLAMSSRNAYLSKEERIAAVSINRALRKVKQLYRAGDRDTAQLLNTVRQEIDAFGEAKIQYAEVRTSTTLQPSLDIAQPDDRVFLAVFIGQTRLIDNAPLGLPCSLDQLEE